MMRPQLRFSIAGIYARDSRMPDNGAKDRGGWLERHVLPRAICECGPFRETELLFELLPCYVVNTAPGDVDEQNRCAEDDRKKLKEGDACDEASSGRQEKTRAYDS